MTFTAVALSDACQAEGSSRSSTRRYKYLVVFFFKQYHGCAAWLIMNGRASRSHDMISSKRRSNLCTFLDLFLKQACDSSNGRHVKNPARFLGNFPLLLTLNLEPYGIACSPTRVDQLEEVMLATSFRNDTRLVEGRLERTKQNWYRVFDEGRGEAVLIRNGVPPSPNAVADHLAAIPVGVELICPSIGAH